LFLLIAQLIFTQSLRKSTSPLLLIWNLVFKVSFGTLSQKHLRTVARGSRPVARAPHIGGTKWVLGWYYLSSTRYSLYYHTLTVGGTNGTSGTTFSKLFETFFKNTVLFCKKNFNLNLLSTIGTTPSIPYISRDSAFSNLVPSLVPT
jgi:hypothetical protein